MTTLYRFFDAEDRLLYIGIAGNPGRRFHEHGKDKDWWPTVVRSTMEHHKTREAALIAERKAILTEHPIYNVVHNHTPGELTPPNWRRTVEARDRVALHRLAAAINATATSGTVGETPLTRSRFLSAVALTTALLPFADYCERCEFDGSGRDPLRFPLAVAEVDENGLTVLYGCHICDFVWHCSWGTETPIGPLLRAVDNLGRNL